MKNNIPRFDFNAFSGITQEMYLLLTTDLRVETASRVFLQTMQVRRRDVQEKNLFEIRPYVFHSRDSRQIMQLENSLKKVIRSCSPDMLPFQKYSIRRTKGTKGNTGERYWVIMNFPVAGKGDDAPRVLHRIEDVTEFLQMGCSDFSAFSEKSGIHTPPELLCENSIRMQLDQKEKDLAYFRKELEQFAYIASHDLQEPLRTITSYIQLFKKRYTDKLDSDANDFIGHILSGSNRMRSLLYSLLEYSRSSRTKPFERVNCNELLDDVLNSMNSSIHESHALIINEELPVVAGDKVLLSELLQKLIANSIKFKSEKLPEIKITAEKQNNQYLFSVRDNGIGFEQKYADKIFGVFQRLHTREKYEGTGMGLAICKKIIEQHKGKIWAESILGQGSTFYFTLPCIYISNPSPIYEIS